VKQHQPKAKYLRFKVVKVELVGQEKVRRPATQGNDTA